MSLPNELLPVGLLATGDTQYRIERSLRFNSSDSAYLSRTPTSASNRKTWTWSGWVKRSRLSGSDDALFIGGGGSGLANAGIDISSDKIRVVDYNGSSIVWILQTTAVLRDTSAWYHIVVSLDTTQSTASDRVKIWINGTLQTSFSSSTYPSQNVDSYVNSTQVHYIGASISVSTASLYLADIHFIDGQALTPSSFAETNITTDQWVPKAYTGTYGTNGFRLAFADNSNNTATTLGKDSSGNGNNWTPNNLSVTAGAGNDSLVDTPTSYGTDTSVGGEVRGNYATLNPLATGTTAALANGNLDFSSASVNAHRPSTVAIQSGKWYCEFLITGGASGGNNVPGIVGTTTPSFPGSNSTSYGYYGATGAVYNNSGVIATYPTFTDGDIISVAFDADSGKIWFAKNGTWQGSGNPATGANPTATATLGTYFFAAGGSSSGAASCSVNFGQRPFAYPVSGFKALCDTNLPTPVVAKPNSVFDVKLYSGNGSSQTISGLGFSPDLVWTKSRSNGGFFHRLQDTVRGATKELYSNSTNAEGTNANSLTAFNSDGFTLGSESGINGSGETFVAWNWDAGSSTVTNTQGSITSQVRANASAGFSIVTYTGTGSVGSVGHGLNVAPKLYIMKNRTSVVDWIVHTTVIDGTNDYLLLNTTDPAGNSGEAVPTSSVINISNNLFEGSSSNNYVVYCFAPVAGYSSFGSYTGNGSADGPFVFCNFRPRWIIIKETSGVGNWMVWDTSRSSFNVMDDILVPNSSSAEITDPSIYLDTLSNGFKIRSTSDDYNGNGATFIYAAFAESPFQYSRAR